MDPIIVLLFFIAVIIVAIVVAWVKQRNRYIGDGGIKKSVIDREAAADFGKEKKTELERIGRYEKKRAELPAEAELEIAGGSVVLEETFTEEKVEETPRDRGTIKAAGDEGEAPEDRKVETPSGVRLDEGAEDRAVAEQEKERFDRKLKRLRQGLAPTRGGLISKLGSIFRSKKELDPKILEDLEEVLLTSDVGTKTAQKLLNTVQQALEKEELSNSDAAWDLLREAVREILTIPHEPWDFERSKPFVIMVVGVNGVGKTTTIGKLATKYAEMNKKVVLAAADTFRAAAVNQLTIWGRRAEAEVVKSKEGADPSSVVFDAVKKAKESDADIVIADTAGRLHTQQPLMEELRKIYRVMGKAHETSPHEVLLVLDATTGQNAIQQVAMFKDTLNITGLALTKLDGTAKGGVIIGICHEHRIPIRFIGIGEAKEDLREFDVDDFVDALFFKEAD